MKAITLHQPWASLVAAGWKEVETRSWSTPYRGPLAIHAGKKRDRDGMVLHMTLNSVRGCSSTLFPEFEAMPFGAIVATCFLMDCAPMVSDAATKHRLKILAQHPFEPRAGWEFEKEFGNYAHGRFAWILQNVVPVDPPIPAHGWQQLWNWEPPQHVSAESGLRP